MSKPPVSAQRKADFREIARELHRSAINPAQAIAAALERAYKRGWQEATEGPPPEPRTAAALPWSQIPPRPRAAFGRLCFYARPYSDRRRQPPEPFTATAASDRLMLIHSPPFVLSGWTAGREEWRVSHRHEVRGVFGEWETDNDSSYGVTTINPLIRLGLLITVESLVRGETRRAAFISEYGASTWLAEAVRLYREGQPFDHLR